MMNRPPFPGAPGMPPFPGAPRPGMPPFPVAPGMPPFPGGPPGMMAPPGMVPPGMMPGLMGAPLPYQPGAVSAIMMPGRPGMMPLRPPQFIPQLRQQHQPRPQIPAPAAQPASSEKSTTVYVGKIAPTLEDSTVRSLLEACGSVKSWKRAEDPETKQPKGFGFCEFEDAEGVLRAIRLLNGLKLNGQELLLKANTATQKYMEAYEAQKARDVARERAERAAKARMKQEEGEVLNDEDSLEDQAQKQDNLVLEKIMTIASEQEEKFQKNKTAAEHASSFLSSLDADSPLPPPPPLQTVHRSSSRTADGGDEEQPERRDKDYRREADRERREEEERRWEADRAYETKLREWERAERERLTMRERERERQKDLDNERRRQCRADMEASDSDDELEPWQRRPYRTSRRAAERRKRRLQEEAEDEEDRQREAREAASERAKRQRLHEEGGRGYDEAHDAAEYHEAARDGWYGGRGEVKAEVKSELDGYQVKHEFLEGPMKQESHEPEFDANDAIYQAMIAAARAPPPQQLHPTPSQAPQHALRPQDQYNSIKSDHRREIKSESPPSTSAPAHAAPAAAPATVVRVPGGPASKKAAALATLFGEDEEEETRKRKLKPIVYTEEELKAVEAPTHGAMPMPPATAAVAPQYEDPKLQLRRLMDSIPTSKDGVWGFKIKWQAYDATTMAEKFKGWVSQKVEQLLGMPEPTLVGYVMQLMAQHTPPAKLAEELSPVLDSDTDTFVIKLYRMVIYETEKLAAGL